MNFNPYSRRRFLKHSACAAMGTTTILNTLLDLCKTKAVGSSGMTTGYKALVCILFDGGNDSYNMLMPRGSEYSEYAAVRTNLAIPQADILPLNPITPIPRDLGIHPNMGAVKTLFDNGKLSFISNIGTLVEPILDVTEYNSGTVTRPQKLYSHSDQKQQWQTSIAQERTSLGWGGRTAELLSSMNSNQNISLNISLEGKNIFQASNSILEYTISNEGNGALLIDPISGYNNQGFLNTIRNTGVDNIASQNYLNVLEKTIANLTGSSIEASEIFSAAIAAVPPFTSTFSDIDLSEDLHMVAKTIAARNTLGMSRQIFFVKTGGFDTHTSKLTHDNLMLTVSTAMSEFYAALEEIGIQDDVVTFTISDFARTTTSNGNGSDHAWGGHQMVMGGAINGQEIYGAYPSLDLDQAANPLNVSDRGRLIPTTSCDEYFAELISWFGVSDGDIPYVLPNIGNFYSTSSTTPPIGFLL